MRPIDADALIPMMKYATTDSEIGVFPILIGFDAIKKVIDEQPTIEKRQHGRWEHKRVDYEKYYVYGTCSECRERSRINNYCPNCGADMRGEHDG